MVVAQRPLPLRASRLLVEAMSRAWSSRPQQGLRAEHAGSGRRTARWRAAARRGGGRSRRRRRRCPAVSRKLGCTACGPLHEELHGAGALRRSSASVVRQRQRRHRVLGARAISPSGRRDVATTHDLGCRVEELGHDLVGAASSCSRLSRTSSSERRAR